MQSQTAFPFCCLPHSHQFLFINLTCISLHMLVVMSQKAVQRGQWFILRYSTDVKFLRNRYVGTHAPVSERNSQLVRNFSSVTRSCKFFACYEPTASLSEVQKKYLFLLVSNLFLRREVSSHKLSCTLDVATEAFCCFP